MSEAIIQKLDRLAELRSQIQSVQEQLEKEREKVLAKVRPKLDKIEADIRPKIEGLGAEALALESDIRKDVIGLGESVKGKSLFAVYAKGRVTWDSKGLDGFAVANPKILAFRRLGDPSVSIRAVSEPTETKAA